MSVRPPAHVTAIQPDVAVVPSNLLRLYVHFSAPMSEGHAARAVSLRRADDDTPLDGVLLEMDPELWDPERRRLTLLLEPGRIKRGLAPNVQAGAPLVDGQTIVVTVDHELLRDAHGAPLGAAARRSYTVGPALRTRVDPDAWHLAAPPARTTEPLVVRFDRPLDPGMLLRCLAVVRTADGTPVPGRATIAPGGLAWRFTPAVAWRAAGHALRVDADLEDVAGNSPRRVFDRDLTRADDRPLDVAHVDRAFAISDADGPRDLR